MGISQASEAELGPQIRAPKDFLASARTQTREYKDHARRTSAEPGVVKQIATAVRGQLGPLCASLGSRVTRLLRAVGVKQAKHSVITLADRARDAGQWQLAATHYRTALRRKPKNPPIWVQRGHVLKESGHLADAEQAYRTAVFYDPGCADSHLQLGRVLKIQGKNEEAGALYLRAIALDPLLESASIELTQLGWSEAHVSEVRGMLGTDSRTPQATGAKRTPSKCSPVLAAQEQTARTRQHDFTSHHSSEWDFPRMRSTKVFNLSLHRSATASFTRFMTDHGFRATHWPGLTFDKQCCPAVAHLDTNKVFQLAFATIEANEVFADVPYCFLYEELMAAYPDATYLIILRSVHAWINSVRRHIGDRKLQNLEKLQYGLYIDDKYDHIFNYTDAQLEAVYTHHLKTVVNLAQTHRASFRLFELEQNTLHQTRLMAELSEYLGFPARTRFPALSPP